jgi:hypothetical protein
MNILLLGDSQMLFFRSKNLRVVRDFLAQKRSEEEAEKVANASQASLSSITDVSELWEAWRVLGIARERAYPCFALMRDVEGKMTVILPRLLGAVDDIYMLLGMCEVTSPGSKARELIEERIAVVVLPGFLSTTMDLKLLARLSRNTNIASELGQFILKRTNEVLRVLVRNATFEQLQELHRETSAHSWGEELIEDHMIEMIDVVTEFRQLDVLKEIVSADGNMHGEDGKRIEERMLEFIGKVSTSKVPDWFVRILENPNRRYSRAVHDRVLAKAQELSDH